MSTLRSIVIGSILASCPVSALAHQTATPPASQVTAPERDGQHDFDFELGTWTTNVRVLRNPLSGQAPN